MTETADPLPPLKAAERHPRLAVDTFCVECGYNLHSQEVTRDERLGIFVCRCPECGRFHPAGAGITATRPWANRLATMLLVFWVLIILFALFWIVMGFGALQMAHVESFTDSRAETLDGRETEWMQPTGPGPAQQVLKGTTQPVNNWRYVRAIRHPVGAELTQYRWNFFFETLGTSLLGFAVGMLMVVFFWHWKRRGYAIAMLLPFVVAGFVIVILNFDDQYDRIRPWAIQVVLGFAALEMCLMGAGVLLGRKIARGLLRMFIPPKPRQHFAFLWAVDGKEMTPAVNPS
jgi:hypothetical protein